MSESTKGMLILIAIAIACGWYFKSRRDDNIKFCTEKGMSYAPIDRGLAKLCSDEHGLIHQFPD